MKKLLFVLLAALTIVGCQKKEETPQLKEVSFNAIEISPNTGLKSTADWECKDVDPTNAWVVINGTDYFPEVFKLDGRWYTQSFKLDEGTGYCVTEFVLYKEVSGDGYTPGVDIAVYGTPHVGSDYAVYVNKPLGNVNNTCVFQFDVSAFTKVELDIQVLCFQDAEYSSFGFNWFQITEIVVRELCFFGDICVTDPSNEAWDISLYARQLNGIQIDMPAIFWIEIKDESGNLVPYSPWGNVGWFGEGAPLCVAYPDNLMVNGETFTLELYLYGPLPEGGFGFTLYATYIIVDDIVYNTDDPDAINENTPILPDGDDGIFDFVVGDCVNIPPDIYFPPYDPYVPPVEEDCETSYAYFNEQYSTCFIGMDEIDAGNKWGWTNGPFPEGTYSFDVYAGAGQCDLEKGTLVGTLVVTYMDGEATFNYTLNSGFALTNVHLYAGNEVLYRNKKGEYSITPGQSPWVDEDLDLNTYEYTFSDLSGNIYIIAHATVCGVYN